MIKPTIGRKVWYWPTAQDRHEDRMFKGLDAFQVIDSIQPCDATVVFVHDDEHVNLYVVDHRGNSHQKENIYLDTPEEGKGQVGGGYAQWMPYQVGQAKAQEPPPVDNEHVSPGCKLFHEPNGGAPEVQAQAPTHPFPEQGNG